MKSKMWKTIAIIGGVIVGLIMLVVALATVLTFSDDMGSSQYMNSSGYKGYYSSSFAGDAAYSEALEDSSDAISEAEKVITKNRINIETKNIAKSVSSIEALVKSYEGKIISKNIDLGDSRYGSVTVKIPSNKGNEFVDKLNKDYDVSSYSTDVSDVTEQYVNTEKEIKNLRKKIKLYEELASKTSIKEIDTRTDIIDKIFSLEREIEGLQEQNKGINKNIEYRDVVITLSAPDKIQGERNYWHNTAQMIVLVFQGSLRVLIALIALSIPFGILIALPIMLHLKKKKKHQN